jgi:hypothetical protein
MSNYDYTIITNDEIKFARAIKNNTGWNLITKDFYGGSYKGEAIRWVKKAHPSATFEIVTEREVTA